VGKIRNNLYFRIIGQINFNVLCPINGVKLLIIKDLWKFLEIIHFTGEFKGGEAPQSIKMGIYKAKPYFSGWVGKI